MFFGRTSIAKFYVVTFCTLFAVEKKKNKNNQEKQKWTQNIQKMIEQKMDKGKI